MKRTSLILLSLIYSLSVKAQNINTIAGMGQGSRIDNVAATSSALGVNYGKSIIGPDGNLYIADGTHNVVRMVDKNTGIITTIAGNGGDQFQGDGGPAILAEFDDLKYITFSPAGDLYISDFMHHRVRKVDMQTGIVTTVVGDGGFTFNGDGVPATSSSLDAPAGIAFMPNGDMIIADNEMNRIRKVAAGTNIISTICGNGTGTNTGDGGLAVNATINKPEGICIDDAGNIYIAVPENDIVRMIGAQNGIITTFAGTGTSGYSGDGGQALLAELSGPCDVACDKNGHIYIADNFNHVVRRVNGLGLMGLIGTVAGDGTGGFSGDGGLATNAELNRVAGISVDTCDNLYVSDRVNRRIRKVTVNNCAGLAVNEISAEQAIEVFPNPAYETLNITSEKKINTVIIFDVTGKKLMQQIVNSTKATLDVSNLRAGVYFVSIDNKMVKFVH